MPSSKPASKLQRRRRIFLVARKVFVGRAARARDRTTIQNVISRHAAAFESLKQDFGEITVVNVLSSLLDKGIFESELNAKLAFPELYQPSQARNIQHDASEQEVAVSEEEALNEASRSDIDHERNQDGPWIDAAGVDPVEDPLPDILSEPPSLFPSYLLYPSQHKLLNTVQRVLEDCCYDWATKWSPYLLAKRRWSCSEAVELGTWSETLPRLLGSISFAATTCESGRELAEVLQATHQLRHAAVHRLPTSVKGIERMLQHASILAISLQDQERMIKLDYILTDFQALMQDMELHKNDLESRLDEELRDIQEQRRALDRKETEAKLNMLQQDQENTATISSRFERSIMKLTLTGHNDAGDTEHNNSQEMDPEEFESDAVAVDTAHGPSGERDESAAASVDCDSAYSRASARRDGRFGPEHPPGIVEQPAEDESTELPSELDPDELESAVTDLGSMNDIGSSPAKDCGKHDSK